MEVLKTNYENLETEPLNEQILQEIHENYLKNLEPIFTQLLEKYLNLVDLELKKS